MARNEHSACTITLFCAVMVYTIQKWDRLENVCDTEQRSDKTFTARKKQTGSKRTSDKKRLNYVGTGHKAPAINFARNYQSGDF